MFVSAKLALVAILDVDVNLMIDLGRFILICSVFCAHASKNMISRPLTLQTKTINLLKKKKKIYCANAIIIKRLTTLQRQTHLSVVLAL